jgi:glycerol uptake facilitator-like aquaporin
MKATLARRIVSEFIGTGFLVAAVIGSGIMGDRLSGGNAAIALLANAMATGAALVALILAFGPVSGAHFNPAVTLADAFERGVSWSAAACYIPAQCIGAISGAIAAHGMFGLPAISWSHHERSGPAEGVSEFIATFGLLCVIWGASRYRSRMVPFAVGAYITAAYWFTSSTSFANPAVTVARSLSDTFAGIRPSDVPLFLLAQLAGAMAATFLFRWLVPGPRVTAHEHVVSARSGFR